MELAGSTTALGVAECLEQKDSKIRNAGLWIVVLARRMRMDLVSSIG